MHDVSLTPQHASKNGTSVDGQLVLQGTVKTYRYLDEDEAAAEAKKGPAKAGRRK
jgi:type IV pilus assembly protein PilO